MTKNTPPIIEVSKNALDHHSVRARCIIAVFPFQNPTVKFKKVVTAADQTPDTDNYTALEKGAPVIITDDCVSLQVSTGKTDSSHVLNATLVPGDYDYLGFLDPGDYVYAWITNSPETFDKVIKALNKGEQANFYGSGLVFFGQVENITENFAMDNQGNKQFRYALHCAGFKPYASNVMWTPIVYPEEQTIPIQVELFNTFHAALSNVSQQPKNAVQFEIQQILMTLHKLYIGGGYDNFGLKGNTVTNKTSASFILPGAVGSVLLTKDDLQKNLIKNEYLMYSQVINCLFGIQKYNNSQYSTGSVHIKNNEVPDAFGPFNFQLNQEFGNYNIPFSEDEWLRGTKVINVTTNLNGVISGLLKEYSNILINELYFTLRPDPTDVQNRGIMPTLVIRQIPFTKSTSLEDLHVTYFAELPRYVIDPALIHSHTFSKSDALRVNTLALQPEFAFPGGGSTPLKSVIKANDGFLQDISDTARNGLRMFESSLSVDLINKSQAQDKGTSQGDDSPIIQKFAKYLEFLGDIWQNLHLKLTGSLEMAGVDIPICVGENAQVGNLLFHIENVAHNYSIDVDGTPHYTTNLELSHGLIIDENGGFVDSIDSETAKNRSRQDLFGYSEGKIKESDLNKKSQK